MFGLRIGIAPVQGFGLDQHGGFARFPLDVSRPRADSLDRNILRHWYVPAPRLGKRDSGRFISRHRVLEVVRVCFFENTIA
jgi:hypothetical protein